MHSHSLHLHSYDMERFPTPESWTNEEAKHVTGSLTSADIIALFDELSEELRIRHARANIYIVGGATMALAFDRTRTTQDIDARVDRGHGALIDAVHTIAQRRGLHSSWLNDQATPKMPMARDTRSRTLYATQYLTITGASAEHMLAMKLESARDFDADDIAVLTEHLHLKKVEEGLAIHHRLFPDSRKRARATEMLKRALEQNAREGTDVDSIQAAEIETKVTN